MGTPFRTALYLIEEQSERIQIEDLEMFYSMTIDKDKVLLFKSGSRARLNDCTCKTAWMRKTGERAPFMCMHQILIELLLWVFP